MAVLTSSCQKEKTECRIYTYYIRPVGVAFIGFKPKDLDTLLLFGYKNKTHLDSLLFKDTIITPTATMPIMGDTVFARMDSINYGHKSGFWNLKAGVTEQLLVPATHSTFTITGTKAGEKYDVFYVDDPFCPTHGVNVMPMRNVHINDTLVAPTNVIYPIVFLKK